MNLPGFEKPPAAIAIDLDGTLLNSRTQLSERNRVALNRCIARGIPVIIATSRPTRSVCRFLGRELADSCSMVLLNGAVARAAPPLSGFIGETLPSTVASDIVRLVLDMEPDAWLLVELNGEEFGTNMNLEPETLWRINSATPDMRLSLEQALDREPTKVFIDGLGHDLSAVAGRIFEWFGDLVSVVPSNDTRLLSIVSRKASKPSALRKLLAPRGISLERVIGFGDDIPDVDMLKECGIAIAVANAVPEVKAVSDYHTASNDDDGVAVVLEQMLTDI